MLMKDDRKKMATIIMGKMGQSQEAPKSEDGAEQDDSTALKTAGEEFAAAIESKDGMRIAESLKALMELCESEEPTESEEPAEPQQP
jgi:hypothetical protein